jgi:hypothetical protein
MFLLNTLINIIQCFIISFTISKAFKVKNDLRQIKVKAKTSICIFMYLEIQLLFTDYEGIGILAAIVLLITLLLIFYEGSFIEKMLDSVIIIILSVFSAVISGNIISRMINVRYVQLVENNSLPKVVGMVITQILYFIFCCAMIFVKKRSQNKYDKGYTILSCAIPCISIVFITLVMENSKSNINIDFLVFSGFFIVNIITFILLEYEKKIYNRQLENEKILFNITKSKTETEAAKTRYMETEKKRHEINRILGTIINLLDAGNVGKAKELLEEFDINHMVLSDSETYTYNIVLNSLLNQKIAECKNRGIDVNCFVSGDINGIYDIDLHILVGNLLDNAMEAAEKSDKKYISIFMYSNDMIMEIKISNTTDLEIVKNNLKFQSTKKESGHGYGILNIKDIVAKYSGEIIYNMVSDDTIQCRVVLIKNKSIQAKN